jgi:N-acetylglutamate synthase-like GNAT family acetyltransferase
MLTQVSFEECRPLLSKLWPLDYQMFDNIHGRIWFQGNEYALMDLRFFLWMEDGIALATTHLYTTGFGQLRVRGTFVDPECRKKGIAQQLVLGAIAQFENCHLAYTFPRSGTEQFYKRLGFKIITEAAPSIESVHGYAYAEKPLLPRTI